MSEAICFFPVRWLLSGPIYKAGCRLPERLRTFPRAAQPTVKESVAEAR